MVDAVGIESAGQRNFNNLQRSRWHDVQFSPPQRGGNGTGTARKLRPLQTSLKSTNKAHSSSHGAYGASGQAAGHANRKHSVS
jgi:hypothetical protein